MEKIEVSECEFAQYLPRFDFYGIAERSVRTNVGKEMDKAIVHCCDGVQAQSDEATFVLPFTEETKSG